MLVHDSLVSCIETSEHVPSKADSTAHTVLVTKDTSRTDLVRSKKGREFLEKVSSYVSEGSRGWTHVFVHRLWEVRDIEIGVVIISERLEFRIK